MFHSFSPQNLIAQSQSGTGKTAAFVLAMLSHVDPSRNYPQVGFHLSRRIAGAFYGEPDFNAFTIVLMAI